MPPIKINQPAIKIVNKVTGDEISEHRSPEEAMEAASSLAAGEYTLVRPDGLITVTGAEPEPGLELTPIPMSIIFTRDDNQEVKEPIFLGAPYPLTHAEAKAVILEVAADVGPIIFEWGGQTHTENSPPFHINGDDRAVAFGAGAHEISITAGDHTFTVLLDVDEPLSASNDPADPQPATIVPFSQQSYPASYYDPMGAIQQIKSKFELLPTDENGWTIISQDPANYVAYVDSVAGDDVTAAPVPQGTPPSSTIAFKTFAAALAALPATNLDGELKSGAHHILLHDDQSFSTPTLAPMRIPSGASFTERLVIGRYGGGVKPPVIDDFGSGYIRFWGVCRFVIVQGVDLYNKFRDPLHAEFVGWGNTEGDVKGGFRFYSGSVGSSHILLEGINMNFCNPKLNGVGHSQIIARRCVVQNTYSEGSHQQGIYGAGSREIMFDECIFDHDGWFKQREPEIKLNTKGEGRATYFNHNTYITNPDYIWLRNCIFMRASSIGTKLTADSTKGAVEDSIRSRYILIESPYYLEGEIGISAGGNTDHNTGHRWNHVYIIDPIFEAIGRGQPTNRTLGWGLDIQDWLEGAVVNPLFLGCDNNAITNTFSLSVAGHCSKIKLLNTISYDVGAKDVVTGAYAVRYREQGQSSMAEIVEEGSIIQNPTSKSKLLSDDVVEGVTRKNCIYFSNNENTNELFKFDHVYHSVAEAMAHPSMDSCEFCRVVFADPSRRIETYMQKMGFPASIEAFAAECSKQTILNWRPEFTAQAVSNYLREGFEVVGIERA